MTRIENIARLAERMEFSDDGQATTIVVFGPNYLELMKALNNIQYDVWKEGNYYHLELRTSSLV